jgi:hypothetical protein
MPGTFESGTSGDKLNTYADAVKNQNGGTGSTQEPVFGWIIGGKRPAGGP